MRLTQLSVVTLFGPVDVVVVTNVGPTWEGAAAGGWVGVSSGETYATARTSAAAYRGRSLVCTGEPRLPSARCPTKSDKLGCADGSLAERCVCVGGRAHSLIGTGRFLTLMNWTFALVLRSLQFAAHDTLESPVPNRPDVTARHGYDL